MHQVPVVAKAVLHHRACPGGQHDPGQKDACTMTASTGLVPVGRTIQAATTHECETRGLLAGIARSTGARTVEANKDSAGLA